MSTQMSLALPYPTGHCEQIKWRQDLWPQHIKDARGNLWLVLHVGGIPTNTDPARFCCFKPKTVEYHAISDVDAFPA